MSGGHKIVNCRQESSFKCSCAEILSVGAAGDFIDFAASSGIAQRLRCRIVKQRARNSIMHTVERSAFCKRDNWCAAGLGFYGDDAKVLALWEDNKSGAAVE